MSSPSHASPDRSRSWWRVGTPLVVLLSGALFAVSAENSDGTDLRPGRYTDLPSLVATEADRYESLQDRVAALDAEVATLAEGVEDASVRRAQQEVAALRDPAGMVPRTGAGLRVTLSDAPTSAFATAGEDANPLVVHQQDIQAVVNAMWRGGARAVTIQGQRVISTTGIRCEGNWVLLQGVPYPEPYVIEAVGDVDDLTAAIDADRFIDGFRADAADPSVAVGFDLDVEEEVTAPAFEGLLDLSYAEPLG